MKKNDDSLETVTPEIIKKKSLLFYSLFYFVLYLLDFGSVLLFLYLSDSNGFEVNLLWEAFVESLGFLFAFLTITLGLAKNYFPWRKRTLEEVNHPYIYTFKAWKPVAISLLVVSLLGFLAALLCNSLIYQQWWCIFYYAIYVVLALSIMERIYRKSEQENFYKLYSKTPWPGSVPEEKEAKKEA